jgi:hypothetical protein
MPPVNMDQFRRADAQGMNREKGEQRITNRCHKVRSTSASGWMTRMTNSFSVIWAGFALGGVEGVHSTDATVTVRDRRQ